MTKQWKENKFAKRLKQDIAQSKKYKELKGKSVIKIRVRRWQERRGGCGEIAPCAPTAYIVTVRMWKVVYDLLDRHNCPSHEAGEAHERDEEIFDEDPSR